MGHMGQQQTLRICATEGCDTRLRSSNTSEYCGGCERRAKNLIYAMQARLTGKERPRKEGQEMPSNIIRLFQ